MKSKLFLLFCILFSILLISTALATTPDGSTPAGDNMNIFITLLFIVATLGLFYTFFLEIAKLATASTTVYDVLLSWCFFILVLMVNHLTGHYVEDTFMYDLTQSFITATVWSNGVFPLISFVISMFIRSTKKKKNLSVAELSGRQLT